MFGDRIDPCYKIIVINVTVMLQKSYTANKIKLQSSLHRILVYLCLDNYVHQPFNDG